MASEKKKKNFVIPEMEILLFEETDVIALSSEETLRWGNKDEENF